MKTKSCPPFSAEPFRLCVVAVLLLAATCPFVAGADEVPVSNAPGHVPALAVGDTLSGAEAARFGLLRDVTALRKVWFLSAPWGGYLACYEIDTPSGPVLRERSVPTVIWSRWRRQIELVLAGHPLPEPDELRTDSGSPAAADSFGGVDRIRVWPEVPLPPLPATKPSIKPPVGPPDLTGRWVMLFTGGYRHPVGEFSTYFTGMGLIGMTVGRNLGAWTPELCVEAGFGDITDDFEDWYEDGRSFYYALTMGVRYSLSLSTRRAVYCTGKGGYFMRSLQWGAMFVDPWGRAWEENIVIEQQNWGAGLRVGMLFLKGDANKSRVLDIGLEVQTFSSDRWHYWSDADGVDFDAGGRDWWLSLSVSIGEAN